MKRMQRAALLMGLITLSFGCQQQLFMEPADRERAFNGGLDTNRLENYPHDPIAPSIVDKGTPPATVLDPSRPARNLTLKECIAIALEQGNIGVQGGVQNAGLDQLTAVSFGGRTLQGSDTIRALVLDPAIVGADIEKALSKFDTRWITSLAWNNQDQAVLNLQQSFSNGDSASFNTTFAKPLPTGGLAGISFSTNYQKLANPPTNQGFVTLATSYTPRLQFIFEQPLLRNFGVEINQLTPSHPGSTLLNGLTPSGGTTTEGILITRIRYDQQKVDFDRQVNQMLLNVEFAYWNLYAAYYNLYAQESTLTQAFQLYVVLKKRYEAGSIRKQEFTQTAAQYWLFRQQAVAARFQVMSAERTLRGLLGMNSFSDGNRLVPIDEPVLAPYAPDYFELANEALANRPELLLARMDLKFRQLDLVLSKNQRRPDLRSFFAYDINGLGQRLDGSEETTQTTNGVTRTIPNNALASFNSNEFNSWQIGLRFDMPLGFRDANAAVRQARLNIVRSYYQLQDAERKTLENVTQQQREVIFQQEIMKISRERRLALQETLDLQQKFIEVGSWEVSSLFNLLQTQRDSAQAIAQEFQAIAQYNQGLASLEFVKGTIQRYNNVSISEGPLPPSATKKAADHFRARALAWKVREREVPSDLAPPMPQLGTPWDSPVERLQLPPLPEGMGVPPAGSPQPPMRDLPVPPDVKPMPIPKSTQYSPKAPAMPEEATFTPVGTMKFPPRSTPKP